MSIATVAPISAIGSLGGIGPAGPVGPAAGTGAGTATTGAASGPGSFASALASGLGQVQQLQSHADTMAVQAATGTLADPAAYLVASTEASLATQLTVAVRDKALDAFNEIMRMPA